MNLNKVSSIMNSQELMGYNNGDEVYAEDTQYRYRKICGEWYRIQDYSPEDKEFYDTGAYAMGSKENYTGSPDVSHWSPEQLEHKIKEIEDAYRDAGLIENCPINTLSLWRSCKKQLSKFAKWGSDKNNIKI